MKKRTKENKFIRLVQLTSTADVEQLKVGASMGDILMISVITNTPKIMKSDWNVLNIKTLLIVIYGHAYFILS